MPRDVGQETAIGNVAADLRKDGGRVYDEISARGEFDMLRQAVRDAFLNALGAAQDLAMEIAERSGESKWIEDPDVILDHDKIVIAVDEVAHVVAMLCADGARGINGQAIAIDGGQVMR